MQKNCFIFWDDDTVPEEARKIYIQCEECFKKNRKGFPWGLELLRVDTKCNLCDTILYKRKKKKRDKTP